MSSSTTIGAHAAAAVLVCASAALLPPSAASAQEITGWHLDAINAPQAQQVSTGEGVVVAIVDTGIGRHPYLERNVLEGTSFIEEDPRDDGDNHGTHMAGAVRSVAPEAQLLPVQVMVNRNGIGNDRIAQGIRWAADNGADVINVSLAVTGDGELVDAVQYALDQDAVVVAGTGNEAGAEILPPAAFPGVVAVSGVAQSGSLWERSTTGPQVALGAPAGDGIPAIVPEDIGQEAGYMEITGGTSTATALTSGVTALVRSAFPDLDGPNVVNRLIATAVDAGAEGRDDQYGFGKLDAHAALTADVEPVTANPLGNPSDVRDEYAIEVTDFESGTGSGWETGSESDSDASSGSGSVTPAILTVAGGLAVVLAIVLVARNRRRPGPLPSGPGAPPTGQHPPGTQDRRRQPPPRLGAPPRP